MGLRLRPMTALSVILAIAFALQLVAVLSVPVTRSITLCTYGDIQFGVFGYCDTKTNICSDVRIGYGDVTSIDGFSLPSNARHTLASLLIVHVVAAGLTLILLLLTLIAHFPGAATSSKLLLIILIFSLPCFLLSLLAFLVDILLFVPHLDWGGWIVLASTVLIAIFGVFLCVLRRTTSSRKAMERRIHENSELQSLGPQYNSAFSGGVSYKPTTSSGDLIFSNSTDGYKPLNPPLPTFNEVKYETNISSYSAGTEDDAPLTSNIPNPNPEISFNSEVNQYDPNDSYDNNYTQRTPSPSQEYQSARYNVPTEQDQPNTKISKSNYRPVAPSDYSQSEYSSYTDYPTNQATTQIQPYPSSVLPITNPILPPNNQASNNNYPIQSGIPSGASIPDILPAGTYGPSYRERSMNPPSESNAEVRSNSHYQQHQLPYQKLPPKPLQPQQWSYQNSNNQMYFESNSTSTPGSSNPILHQYNDSHSLKNIAQQEATTISNIITTSNSNSSLPQPSDSKAQPGQKSNYTPQYQQERQFQPRIDQYKNTSNINIDVVYPEHPPLSNEHLIQTKRSQQSVGTSPSPAISDSSHFTSISQRGPNHRYNLAQQQQSQHTSQRHDILLQSNPDFELSTRGANNRVNNGRKKSLPAASSLTELGDNSPYGISKMNFN